LICCIVNKKYADVVVRYFIFARNVIKAKSIVLTNADEQDIVRVIERHREDTKAQKMVRRYVIMPQTDVDMVGKNTQVSLERY
jgi:ferritin-like metal-binding protein YciE